MNVKEVIDRARLDLVDASAQVWSNTDLLAFLNEGRQTLYLNRPRIYESTEVVTLVEGHRQTIPNGSKFLFTCIENVSHVSRRAITPMDRALLDRVRPRWRGESPRNFIAHFAVVPTEPGVYEVYPPAVPGTTIRLSYGKPPAKLTMSAYTTMAELTHEGELAPALIDYIVYAAYQSSADAAPDEGAVAEQRLNAFMARISGEATSRANTSPNSTAPGGRPPGTNA